MLALAACGGGTPAPERTGTLEGRVSIGPLCPVEPCANAVNPYQGRSLELRGAYQPLRLVALADDGTFSAQVPAGLYTVGLTDCGFLGCGQALPVRVEVRAGETATLTVDIDTGIR
jgi:hypothetical protein